MSFAYAPPVWALVLIVAAAVALAASAYVRWRHVLTRRQLGALVALRTLSLLLLVLFLLRPVALEPSPLGRPVVAILLDASRSMGLTDADGRTRFEAARDIVRTSLLPMLDRRFRVEVLAFSDHVTPADLDTLRAEGPRTAIGPALAHVRDRFRDQLLAGIVLLSDGVETDVSSDGDGPGVAVFPIPVGSPDVARDREVADLSAGATPLTESIVDLTATVVSRGDGRTPFDLRLLADGRPAQVRRVVPSADGAPSREVFRVQARRDAAVVYTVEATAHPSEITAENNRRAVLVQPTGRRRRVLLVEGAPGHEHSFLKRALATDTGLDVDSVVRKGQNDRGEDTFYVQAAGERAPQLTSGYPLSREALFVYDAVVLANIEGDFFSREQLAETSAFVSDRGGGLLLLGARSFDTRGLLGTALEDLLPLSAETRGTGFGRVAAAGRAGQQVTLTREGLEHPVMRLAATADENREKWSRIPALAGSVAVGSPKPGATVLAEIAAPSGMSRPLVAVQRFGEGRSMVFTGEASWRWRMQLPSDDRSYETFWRQAVRWLAAPAPDPVSLRLGDLAVGQQGELTVVARDAAFRGLADAAVRLHITGPDDQVEERTAVLRDGATGTYVARFEPRSAGAYEVRAEVVRGGKRVGEARGWLLAGGSDPEFVDPRRDDGTLERLARRSGGRVVPAADTGRLPEWLAASVPISAPPVQRDLWHSVWSFLVVVLFLSVEWALRRRWGLR